MTPMTETAVEAPETEPAEAPETEPEAAEAEPETSETPKPQAGDYAPKKDRAASLQATRKAKMDEFFKGKKFEIAKEVHLDADKDPFVTPFGNKGRHGYVLKEIGNDSNKFIIGETMLRQVANDYDAVEMPVKERKRRTKEQKAADDAASAETVALQDETSVEQADA